MQSVWMRFAPHKTRVIAGVLIVGFVFVMLTGMAMNTNVYQVTDGTRTKWVSTFSEDTNDIMRKAGFSTDEYAMTDLKETKKGSVLTVDKLYQVIVKADGSEYFLQTVSGTVGELLAKHNIALGENDFTSKPLTAATQPQDTILITRVTFGTATKKQEVPFTTEKKKTAELLSGKTRIARQGTPGEKTLTYRVTYHDGVEVAREQISEEVTQQPVSEVLEVGTANSITTRDGQVLRYSKVIQMKATAYSTEGKEKKRTATGTVARVGAIAVDPDVIPYGTQMYITSLDGKSWVYGIAVAEDCGGGGMKGNRVDLFFNTQKECFCFGRRSCKVYILD